MCGLDQAVQLRRASRNTESRGTSGEAEEDSRGDRPGGEALLGQDRPNCGVQEQDLLSSR